MDVVIHIRDEKTKRVADYAESYDGWGADRGPDVQIRFIWSEGNYACDCNRYLFYTAAVTGEWPDGEGDETPCGHDLYAVQIVEKESGRMIYQDDRW